MNRKGQNVVEYILVVAAMVAILLVFLKPSNPFRSQVEKGLFEGPVKQIQSTTDAIKF